MHLTEKCLATAIVLAAFAAPASAAPYNWNGCYVGVSGGAGILSDAWTGASGGDLRGIGGLAGGQAGCNVQFDTLVAGIEGDLFWTGIQNSYTYNGGPTNNFNDTTKNPYDFDVAARFGLTFDRAFIYGKGGVVWGRFNFFETQNYGLPSTLTASSTLPGLLLGLGLEYGLTPHWTAKMEYDYLGFASTVVTQTCQGTGCTPPTSALQSYGATEQLFKLGINYKFGDFAAWR